MRGEGDDELTADPEGLILDRLVPLRTVGEVAVGEGGGGKRAPAGTVSGRSGRWATGDGASACFDHI